MSEQTDNFIRTYPIAIAHENTGLVAYGIEVPDFNNGNSRCSVFSAADEFSNINSMAIEAIELGIEGLLAEGHPIPLPKKIDDWIHTEGYEGYLWTTVDVDVGKLMSSK